MRKSQVSAPVMTARLAGCQPAAATAEHVLDQEPAGAGPQRAVAVRQLD
ncbi:MAG TPA: hypothetical protein VGH53_06365 [Streptosporangiaceae bacterium]